MLALAFTFSCSSGNDNGGNDPGGSSSSSGGIKESSSSNSGTNGNYCYGYSNYKDCNLVGGKWIFDEQHCFSGGGILVNTDYCNKNGIVIDNTPSDQPFSSSTTQIRSSSSVTPSSSSYTLCYIDYGDNTAFMGICQSSSSVVRSSSSATSSSSSIMPSSSSVPSSSSSVMSSSSATPSSSSIIQISSSSSVASAGSSSSVNSSSSLTTSSSSITPSSSSIVGCTAANNTTTQYCSNGTMKQYGSVTDNNGNTYRTVQIGDQVWMAEDLLNYYGDKEYPWSTAMALPGCCDSDNCYGNVDNYMCAKSTKHRGLCPFGWHIPNNADLNALLNFINPSCSINKTNSSCNVNCTTNYSQSACANAGTKLKATSGWNSNNGTDDYSFSALPSYSVSNCGHWWTSDKMDQSGMQRVWYLSICGGTADYSAIGITTTVLSVRCIQD